MECSAHAKLMPRGEPDPTMIIAPLSANDFIARMKQDRRTNSEPGVQRAAYLEYLKANWDAVSFPFFLVFAAILLL